jgi:hypothetical protein
MYLKNIQYKELEKTAYNGTVGKNRSIRIPEEIKITFLIFVLYFFTSL